MNICVAAKMSVSVFSDFNFKRKHFMHLEISDIQMKAGLNLRVNE